LGNYFKLNAPRRKGVPQRRKQKSSPTHVPSGKGGLSCFGEQLLLGRKGPNSPREHNFLSRNGLSSLRSWEQASECFDKKV